MVKKEDKTFTKVYEEWSEQNCSLFSSHTLGSQLIAFFIVNFGEQYVSEMKGKFKEEIVTFISITRKEFTL